MKDSTWTVIGLCLFATGSTSLRASETSNADGHRKPNVVIFLTDDQGTLDANCYGSKDLYTPAMDKLAETGVRFTQAYSHKEVFAKGEYYPDLITARALQYVDKNKDVPFFLYVAFNLPHYPEQPDPKFDERYKNMPMPRQSYAKVISTVDDHIGQIVDRLGKHGLRDNTIVVFMSDNGHSIEDYPIRSKKHTSGLPEGWNYGANGGGGNTGKWRGHKAEFYEGGIRVPAVISWPAKLPKGIVRDQAITAMDWLPTIVDLCGIDPPDSKLDGQSVVPIIESESARTHNQVMHWAWQVFWAVREGEWKLISLGDKNRKLVNLNDAEPERKNYIKEKPEIEKHLQALHDAWAKETKYVRPW